jgi:hypothetical protein
MKRQLQWELDVAGGRALFPLESLAKRATVLIGITSACQYRRSSDEKQLVFGEGKKKLD